MENNSSTQDRELKISRLLNAPVDLVWEAFINPEHIAKWWGPNGFTNTISTMDVRPGGEWNLIMHGPDGTNYPNKSTFQEVVPLKKIVFKHFHPDFTATITFEGQGDKTFLNWHMVFDSVEEFIAVAKAHGAEEGLKQNIEKLHAYMSNPAIVWKS